MEIYQLENRRFIVAEYSEKNNQYTSPMDAKEKKLTGCHTAFARKIENLDIHSYSTKASAERWAESQGYEISE